MLEKPLKIQEKNLKKDFLGIYPGTKSLFLWPKKFSKFFQLQLVPGATIQKKYLKHR
jgi:hypothetical protein